MAETLLKARRFTVERRQVPLPDGRTVDRELVVHPGAVLILPVRPDGQIVLIHNYRFAVGAELLELPAGTLEPNEEPIACAAREVEEETGYRAGRLEPLGEFYTTPGFTDELMHAYVAYDLTETAQNLDDSEQIRVTALPLDEAVRAATDGRIIDGKTIAALLMYARKSRDEGCH